ncbi:MAG: ABC transporter permease [Acidobacteria bacterium]|nr:ABC transporter permease [Acidobacteriota bacterium]
MRPWLRMIGLVSLIVPRRLRADWRRQWEADLKFHESLLEKWRVSGWRDRGELMRHSSGSFRDALLLQPKRMEEEIFQDLRYGVLRLRKQPGFFLVIILTLGLGIGANTAIFSIVNPILLNPFPYRDHSRLLMIEHSMPQIGMTRHPRFSGPEFIDLEKQNRSFENLAAWEQVRRNLTDELEPGRPEQIPAAKVSGDLFKMLGVEPLLGRVITAEDQGPKASQVLVIGHALWQRRFGGDPGVIGRVVSLDDERLTIIGVMPPNFQFGFNNNEAWFPFPFDLHQRSRSERLFLSLVRLKSGVSREQAQSDLISIARQQEQEFIATQPEYAGRSITLIPLIESLLGITRQALLVLSAAVGLVLLIACANVAGLLLANAVAREKEMAIRVALGAGRRRIVQQLLTESVLTSLCGGALGLVIAYFGLRVLLAIAPTMAIPNGAVIKIDATILVFTLAVSLLSALLFGMWPALQTLRSSLHQSLQENGREILASRSGKRAQRWLVVSEVALSLVLLVMAGLMLRSFGRLMQVDLGFNPENLLTARLNLPRARYQSLEQRATFYQRLIERIETLPGVKGVAVASHPPVSNIPMSNRDYLTFAFEDVEAPVFAHSLDTRTVSASYFRLLGIPLITGEGFTVQDSAGKPGAVIINRTMANRYWPHENPIGQRIRIENADPCCKWLTVRGVVEDSVQGLLDAPTNPEVYFPLGQMADRYRRMNLLVRADVLVPELTELIRREVLALDKDQPIYDVLTMNELIGGSVAPRRFAMWMLVIFAGIAVTLATVGIYSLMSYTVAQNTREIGIRIALGGKTWNILRLVVGHGMVLTSIGVIIGLAASFALTQLITGLLYGVSAFDPMTFGSVAAILTGVALVACYIPARRATKVDPIDALKCE